MPNRDSYVYLGDEANFEPTPNEDPLVSGPKPRVSSSIVLAADGRNYIPWRTIMPSVLYGDSWAWEVVSGKLTQPDPNTADTSEGKEQPAHWLKGNRSGRYILMNSIHPDLAVSLFLDTSEDVEAHEIWRRIKDRFHHADGTRKSLAMAKFLCYRYIQGVPTALNLLRFKKILYEMNEAGFSLEDDLLCSRLLEALPSSWEPFKQSWAARVDTEKHYDTLSDLIEAEALRRRSNDDSEATAMFTRVNNFGRRRFPRHNFRAQHHHRTSTTRRTEVTCYNCNQRGRIQSECRLPRRSPFTRFHPRNPRNHRNNNTTRRPPQRPRRRFPRQANIVEVLNAEAVNNNNFLGEDFVVDSGCAHNMTNNRNWLVNFVPFEHPLEVRFGGSRVLSAQGSGTARISINSNGSPITVELKDTLYVPRLRRNLISVSQLTDDGFEIRVKKDSIRLIKDKTEISAERQNGLYVFFATEPLEANNAGLRKKVSLREAHRAFAHLNVHLIKGCCSVTV